MDQPRHVPTGTSEVSGSIPPRRPHLDFVCPRAGSLLDSRQVAHSNSWRTPERGPVVASRTRCARFGSATKQPASDVPWPGAALNARCIPTSQPQLVKQRCGSRTAYDPVCWHGNARPTGWARSRARQDTIGLYSVIPEGAAGCRSEPATANAARKSATTSHRALRRPPASASKPMAGGPARLAK